MPKVDIARETQKVGNAMASVRIDQMILNLAKGIARGQYELDKVSVEITKMMGVPGTVSIGDERLSMLEAGFIPSFYHFVDTILEIKMDVQIREEETASTAINEKIDQSTSHEFSAEFGMKQSADYFVGSTEISAKAGYGFKSTSAYSRTLDAKHSQSFSQDLSASSLMRTKLVPVPAPDVLVERIRILLERLKEEAHDEIADKLVFELDDPDGAIATQLDAGDPAALVSSFERASTPIGEVTVTKLVEGARWEMSAAPASGSSGDPRQMFFVERSGAKISVYRGAAAEQKSVEQTLLQKVSEKLMDRIG